MEDSVTINMPPSPMPTPKRVNFSPLPSPNRVKLNGSPGPSSKGKSSMKNLIPRLSFKFRNTNSEIEKAAMIALGASPELRGKTSISRTFSLTKIFTPKIKRTSSLPASPIFHSNPESAHGGISTASDSAVSTSPFEFGHSWLFFFHLENVSEDMNCFVLIFESLWKSCRLVVWIVMHCVNPLLHHYLTC